MVYLRHYDCDSSDTDWRHVETNMGQDLTPLPRRYMPPGTIRDLYRHYTVSVAEDVCAGCFCSNHGRPLNLRP